MRYPFHTESKQVVGQEARTLLRVIESNGMVTNTASQATVTRILARRQAYRFHSEKVKISLKDR